LKIKPVTYNLDAFTPHMLAIGLAGLIMWMSSLKKNAHIIAFSILNTSWCGLIPILKHLSLLRYQLIDSVDAGGRSHRRIRKNVQLWKIKEDKN